MLAITPKGFVPGSGSCGPRYRAQCALADDQVRGDNELFPAARARAHLVQKQLQGGPPHLVEVLAYRGQRGLK